jgi:peptidoglycan/xylan/chitin deacetylase (PgdA/CDA1 family)
MLNAAKTWIKRLVAESLYHTGALWIIGAWILRRRAIVLMYHRVLPTQPRPDFFTADGIVVSAATFDRHMRFLRRFCNPTTPEQLRAMLAGETAWVPRTCLVTFDDGWYDNVEYALPALVEHRIPAAIFVATGYVGTMDTFWQEKLTRRLYAAWRLGERAATIYTELDVERILALEDATARAEIRDLVTRLKARSRAQIDALVVRLERFLEENGAPANGVGDDRFMSWSQAAALRDSGLVAVESHAHSHVPLTSLPAPGIAAELAESRRQLRERIAHESRFLAYPNGDFDDAVVAATRAAGFALAFTTEPGLVAPGDDPLRLKRMNFAEHGTGSEAGLLCRMLAWF